MQIPPDQAADLAAEALARPAAEARPFGSGKFSQTFLITSDGPEEHVMRIAPPDELRQLFYERRMMRQEPQLHERLLAATDAPVPEILHHDFSRGRIDRDWLIMPRLPGVPLSEASLDADKRAEAIRQWGRYIAQAHRITDPDNRFGYLGAHNCMEPQDTWAEAFAVMYRKELDDIVETGIWDSAQADQAISLLEANLDAFGSVDTSCLCHGDIWVTNLMVDSCGQVTGVIDWDRACWGDIEWDLAIAEYCGVTSDAFWAGYGRRIDTHTGPAAMRRMWYLLYEHQKYIVISMSARRNDPAGARRYAADCRRVLEAFDSTQIPQF
ncbi:MAG: phosphotransferase family protein [Planctomycetota bacterium]